MGFFSRLTTSQKIAGISLMGLLIWLCVGFFFHKHLDTLSLQPTGLSEKPFIVDAAVSKTQKKEIIITIDGITKPDRILEIVSKTSGTIEKIYVKKGTIADKNTVLATMDMRTSLMELKEASTSLKAKELQCQIQQQLFERGFSSKVSLARAQVDLDEAKVKEEKARLELEHDSIIAPFKGIIDDQLIEKGTYVIPKTPLFVLLDLDPILITASLPRDLIPQVHENSPVRITFPNGDVSYGKISFKSVLINEKNHMSQIEIAVPNSNYKIHAGQNVSIELLLGTKFVHLVPSKSVSLNEQDQLLIKLIDDDNRVLETPVTVASSDDTVLWLEGLPETIHYIVAGQDFVKPGDTVTLSSPIKTPEHE